MSEKKTFFINSQAASEQAKNFKVPAGCMGLSFEYDLDQKYTFLVFLMIKDPEGKIRFLKQLSYSEPVISIGQTCHETTIGGICGPVPAGIWEMKVFLFTEHILRLTQGMNLEFHVEISYKAANIIEATGDNLWADQDFQYSKFDFSKVYQTEQRWYKGDLHTHTRLSDGKESPENAVKKAEYMQLDYYVPTEHNVLHTGWPKCEICIVPGIEITTTQGHANIFGITSMPQTIEHILRDKDAKKLDADIEIILAECHKKGWLFSVNHPFLSIWKWLYDGLRLSMIDSIEICNDPTYGMDSKTGAEEANQKAVLLADMLYEDGYRICAVGGSDSHNLIDEFYEGASEPSIPGDPATWLYMDKLTPLNLLEALRSCRCYVTRHCTIESNLLFGEELKEEQESLHYWLTLKTQKQPEIFYIHNGKKVICTTISKMANGYIAEGTILLESGYQWIRFGAETKEGSFLFYGNAITKGTKKHSYIDYGEIRKCLEKRWQSKEFYSTKMAH